MIFDYEYLWMDLIFFVIFCMPLSNPKSHWTNVNDIKAIIDLIVLQNLMTLIIFRIFPYIFINCSLVYLLTFLLFVQFYRGLISSNAYLQRTSQIYTHIKEITF